MTKSLLSEMFIWMLVGSLMIAVKINASGIFSSERHKNVKIKNSQKVDMYDTRCSNTLVNKNWTYYKYKYGWFESAKSRGCINFYNNTYFIMKHNKEGKSYKLAMNEFGNMPISQGGCSETSTPTSCSSGSAAHSLWKFKIHSTLDWSRDFPQSVGVVRHQKNCGSCWAFSTIGVLEGWYARQAIAKKTVQFSPQQLVDCAKSAWGRSNNPCKEGRPKRAFEYIKKYGGLATKDTYQYLHKRGDCRAKELGNTYSQSNLTIVRLNFTYHDVKKGDEKDLFDAVTKHGPVLVILYTSLKTFKFYDKGIYNDKACKGKPDHAVIVVGYGYDHESRQPYWIIKNSWGNDWGDGGYMKMVMNQNLCGIACDGIYVSEESDSSDERKTSKPKKVASAVSISGIKIHIDNHLLIMPLLLFNYAVFYDFIAYRHF